MMDDSEIVSVHRRPDPGRMPNFQRNYGLWIFQYNKGSCAQKDGFYHAPNRYFEFYCLSQMFKGAGRLRFSDGIESEIHPGDCVVITPRTIHCYGGSSGSCYWEDTVTFVGPVADMLMNAGILKNGLVHAGPARCLLPIIEAASDPSPESQLRANISLQRLLVDFYLESCSSDTEKKLFDELLKELERHLERWWTVEEMAEYCNLSARRLRTLFRKYTGGTPKAHLDSMKMKQAGKLLTGTDMTIRTIAGQLGYADSYHFARRFREVMGTSPGRYRKS